MTQKNVDSVNLFEQVNQICREFRKQISLGKSPRIEKYLSSIAEDGRETLFSNLLEIEINFRQRKGERPSTDEYLKRFPKFATQVRRAFFEPTMASVDSGEGDGATRSLKGASDASEQTLTFQFPDASRLGDYELLRELGRGGMGVVYEARHTKTNNRVALKTLPTGGRNQEVNADKLYRFRREFRRLSEINHPNLVGMQSLEVDGSQWFFTMDLIDGEDFLSYVRPDGELNETRLRSCLEQLARGVIALHREGIVHRDLKPSNVLVGRDGRVLILDFGLAAEMQRTADMTQTRSGMFAGTPRYAAPEQMFGERTEASDWYAIGTMLYEALAGGPPFTGKNTLQLLRDKQSLEAPSLNERPGIASDLAKVADELIRREPGERMTAEGVANFLQLDLETRSGGTTAGSQGSSGSVAGDELDLKDLQEEEVVLIGREEQLTQLEVIKTDFQKTLNPQVVWVTGLSGEGKSSLVRNYLLPLQRGDEFVVLYGRCYDRESVPYKVVDAFCDQLVSLLRRSDFSGLQGLLPRDIDFLAHLFPILRRVPGIDGRYASEIHDIDERQIKFRAFVALRELLNNISRRKPIVLFVDDLQWGDADSAKILHDLMVLSKPPALLFLGSYRSDEAAESDFLRRWHEFDIETESIKQHLIELAPLSEEQCRAFLEARFADAPFSIRQQAHELFENTKGNPYFLEQLIQAYDPESQKFQPKPLTEIIDRKLRLLPENALSLLKIIAVSGKALPISEVAVLAGKDKEAYGTMAHMRSESLIRIVGSQDEPSVDTYHDKIRETVLGEMPGDERRERHLSFGELIEKQEKINFKKLLEFDPTNDEDQQEFGKLATARLFDLAFHFFESQDSRAFIYQLVAGESSAKSFAFESAMEHLAKARELLPENADAKLQFRLWECMARVNSRLNESKKAFNFFEKALAVAPDSYRRAIAYYGIALERQKQGFIAKSIVDFDSALQEVDFRSPRSGMGCAVCIIASLWADFAWPSGWQRARSAGDAKRARLASEILSAKYHSAMEQGGVQLAQTILKAVKLALRSGDNRRLAFSYTQLGGNLAWAGMKRLSRICLRRAAQFDMSTNDIEQKALKIMFDGVADLANANYSHAIKELEHGIELSLRCGDLYSAAAGTSLISHVHGIASSASQEIASGRQHVEIGEACGDRRTICWGEFCYAHALARHGLLRDAHRYMNRTLKLYKQETFAFTEPIGRSINAFVLLQTSRYDAAQREAELGWEVSERHRVFIAHTVRNLPWLMEALAGECWVEFDEHFDRSYARRLCKRAGKFKKMLMLKPQILRSKGRLHCKMGETVKAIGCFQQSIEIAREQDATYELCRALLDLAAVQKKDRKSNRSTAIEMLRKIESVIPYAEAWTLGDDPDLRVVASASESINQH